MEAFTRVLPFVWPYRRYVILSVLAALMISVLWAGNLSTTLPLVRVLFENKSLHQYIGQEIETSQAELAEREADIGEIAGDDVERLAKAQRHQSEASSRLVMLTTVRKYVLPWVPIDRFDTVALILAGLVLATIFKGFFIYVQEVLVGTVVNRVIVDLRKKCFRHVLELDYHTISKLKPSELTSKITNDIALFSTGIQLILVRLVREPLKAGGCILFAFFLNWRLTLLSMLVVPLIGFVFQRFGRTIKKASRGSLESMAGIFKCLGESFDSMKAVIAFGAGRRHRLQFHRSNREFYRKSLKVVRVSALARPTTEVMGVVAVMAAVLPGTYLVLRGTDSIWGIQLTDGMMGIAELSALYALLAGTLDSVRKLSSIYGDLKRSAAASDRIFAILETKTQVPETDSPRVFGRHASEIRFANVSYTYDQPTADGEPRPPALRNVDLTVKAGEVVAVLGENASGKSTLINLLPRFMDPDHGAVLVDGIDIRDVPVRKLRDQIGLVTQETLLFDDTIYENIRYGKSGASFDEIEDSARRAQLVPFPAQLPEGFETEIGEKGMKISGGQRQRISLARAIVRDPSILILDEATSAVDSQGEQLIHEVLKSYAQDRTVFIITHVFNETFLDLVTRIIVMDHGQIAASGTHEELLASCPIYQRLYRASAQSKAA